MASAAAIVSAIRSTTRAVVLVPVSTPLVAVKVARIAVFSALSTAALSSCCRWPTRAGASSAISSENCAVQAILASSRSIGVMADTCVRLERTFGNHGCGTCGHPVVALAGAVGGQVLEQPGEGVLVGVQAALYG